MVATLYSVSVYFLTMLIMAISTTKEMQAIKQKDITKLFWIM